MIPEMISHFRLIKKLGQGGMGEVYLAQDTKLDRLVALKILPAQFAGNAERMKRFVREARAASSLNHPNVAHIYEISESNGIHFIAMEYVEGETLGAWLRHGWNFSQMVDVAIQVADALARAASKGIIHRDIKPSNIVVASTGEVKILDFGIAKIIRDDPGGTEMETLTHTEPGSVLGTIAYMSPEQALGKSIDPRSDLFSFGVVLYEMSTGKHPFAGASAGETIDRILHGQPESPLRWNQQAPAGLEPILRKCLEKDPDSRYQSAKDVAADLRNLKQPSSRPHEKGIRAKGAFRIPRWLYAVVAILVATIVVFSYERFYGGANEIHSLAVLPFLNATNDPRAEYISDGITDSIINNLSQLRRLRVMARTSVFRYKGKELDPQEVGRQLHVDAVVTGNVNEQGDMVSVQTELVNTKDGSQIWGDQFSRRLTELLSMQSEISTVISQKLRWKLTGEEEKLVAKHYTENGEAYRLYLKGGYEWNKFTAEGARTAIQYFQQAIDADPTYALAYAGLSAAYGVSGANGYMTPSDAFKAAKAAAQKALQLDPELSEAHMANGAMFYYGLDYQEAEKELRRAIALNTNSSESYDILCFMLAARGRFDEAIELGKKGVEVDPLSMGNAANVGWAYYVKRDFKDAESYTQKVINLDQNFEPARNNMISILLAQKQPGRAVDEAKKALALGDNSPVDAAFLAYAYGVSGKKEEARNILRDLNSRAEKEYVSPYYLGLIHLALGDNQRAIALMQQACRQGDVVWNMFYLKVDPGFDGVRNDPGFQELLRCMKLD